MKPTQDPIVVSRDLGRLLAKLRRNPYSTPQAIATVENRLSAVMKWRRALNSSYAGRTGIFGARLPDDHPAMESMREFRKNMRDQPTATIEELREAERGFEEDIRMWHEYPIMQKLSPDGIFVYRMRLHAVTQAIRRRERKSSITGTRSKKVPG